MECEKMNYIINPSWFYWIKVVDTLRMTFIVLGILGIFASVIGLPIYWGDAVYDEADKKRFKKIARGVIIPTVVLWLLIIFTPSKETLIEMQIARYATYENAQWTVESIKSAVDYIVEAVKSMR
jgi:hypothetical protein